MYGIRILPVPPQGIGAAARVNAEGICWQATNHGLMLTVGTPEQALALENAARNARRQLEAAEVLRQTAEPVVALAGYR